MAKARRPKRKRLVGPAPHMPFGMHHGTSVSAVPTQYLERQAPLMRDCWIREAMLDELDRRYASKTDG